MPMRTCVVSYLDHRRVRHSVEVQAESLFEAVCMAVAIFRQDPWLERIGSQTNFEIDVRAPGATHSLSLEQVERWLDAGNRQPSEAGKKARLRMMLVQSGAVSSGGRSRQ